MRTIAPRKELRANHATGIDSKSMDERSLKRLGVMVLTSLVIIVVLKYVGLKMATSAKAAHEKQISAQQASAPAAAPVPPAQPDAAEDADNLKFPLADDETATSAPEPQSIPGTADTPLAPDDASAPAGFDDAPSPADPTVSTPPASLNGN